MKLQLENLEYQNTAIQSVINVFEGTIKNNVDNACFEGIRYNLCNLTKNKYLENIKSVAKRNNINDDSLMLFDSMDLCIEMETGTGKTLVYIKTIYELFKHFGFTKFIIIVPSIAIRQGTLETFKSFEQQLVEIYGFKVNSFEYDSKKLNKVINFIEDQTPQVMVITTGAFHSDDRILNRTQREDLFNNLPYIDAIAKIRPIIIMDEPQEGMDTDNLAERLKTLTADERNIRFSNVTSNRTNSIYKTLDPLVRLRYSATHKIVKNLIYRLTPYDSYKQGLVKKIEVLTVTEKNDEASLKVELSAAEYTKGTPKAKIKAWKLKGQKFVFEETNWLKVGDNLGDKTKNQSYMSYTIERIYKSLKTKTWRISFDNGVEIFEKQTAGKIENIWNLQLEWLINRHFSKSQQLASQGIKCLSLIFIDRVANYMGDNPIIKNLFVEKYKAIYPDYHNGAIPTEKHIQELQGYYFAKNSKGEFSDNEGGLSEQKKIYEMILKKKNELLTIGNPIEFIFSHSALGVGWDNPNVFNIATLSNSYSEIKKRQEIGRGLRICVNQNGQRCYDSFNINDEDRINKLTIIPNESYESFVAQYQKEITDIYGLTSKGAPMSHSDKGVPKNDVSFKLNKNESVTQAFKRFWKTLAKKTDYSVAFNEDELIEKSIRSINEIIINDYIAEVSVHTLSSIEESGIVGNLEGSEIYRLKAKFSKLDIIEDLSEDTGLSYNTVIRIMNGISNFNQFSKNPPQFLQLCSAIIRNTELDEMIRATDYYLTEEEFPFHFIDFIRSVDNGNVVDTPNKGVFDKMIYDSYIERMFAINADNINSEVVCFLKLPSWYIIKTPRGNYEPDFGLVMKRKSLKTGNESEYYFVIETKGTNDINDRAVLTNDEIYKINCAFKHFQAIGIDIHYKAPIKTYDEFKKQAEQSINQMSTL